jgi:hypothetical protein
MNPTALAASANCHPIVNPIDGFTMRTSLESHGRTVDQMQYVAEHYVVTVIGPSVLVFAPGLDGRFLVDRGNRQLRRMDLAAQNPRPEQVRKLLGDLKIERDERPVEVDGYSCQLVRVHNRDARLVVSIDCYCARMEGVKGTALAAERAFDGGFQPFQLPLDEDEIVIRSTTRALAADFEQSQTLRLTELIPSIDAKEGWEEVLRYPIRRT